MKKIMIGILSALMAISMVFSLAGTSFIVADTEPQQSTPTEIKLGGLFPLTGGLMAGGVEREAAARLAIVDINADTNILPSHSLTLLSKDTGTDTTKGAAAATTAVSEGAVGIIGAASSGVSQAVAKAVLAEKKPVVSYSSTAASLSNTTEYPNFARVAPPDSLQAAALAKILVKQNVTEIATLSTSDAYGKGGITELKAALPDTIKVATSQEFAPSATDVSSQLQAIASSDATVVVLNVVIEDAKTVFSQAADAGVSAQDGYIWYGTDGSVQVKVYQDDEGKINQDVIDAAGLIVGTRGYTNTSIAEYKAFIELWNMSDPNTYAGAGDEEPNFYATYAYDAVYLYAHALHAMVTASPTVDHTDGDLLFAQLLKTSFNGATGNVSLNANGDRVAAFEAVQLEVDNDTVTFNVVSIVNVDGTVTEVADIKVLDLTSTTTTASATSSASASETTSDSPFGIIAFVGVFIITSIVSAVFVLRRRR